MRSDFCLFAMLGLANASALINRQYESGDDSDYDDSKPSYPQMDAPSYAGSKKPPPPPAKPWHPKTDHPEFFSLRVDTDPACNSTDPDVAAGVDCTFENFAIRLEHGIVIATPYNQWWDPKLPIFFVDDDTKMYTVSKQPLELFIDLVTGSLKYAPQGWLPPNSISTSFYKTGSNPLGRVSPSPAYLSWPSTQGSVTTTFQAGPWWLCPLGTTGQYQVFISSSNYAPGDDDTSSGVSKDGRLCQKESLAAINANPYKKSYGTPY